MQSYLWVARFNVRSAVGPLAPFSSNFGCLCPLARARELGTKQVRIIPSVKHFSRNIAFMVRKISFEDDFSR
jgi:hypothetical protein